MYLDARLILTIAAASFLVAPSEALASDGCWDRYNQAISRLRESDARAWDWYRKNQEWLDRRGEPGSAREALDRMLEDNRAARSRASDAYYACIRAAQEREEDQLERERAAKKAQLEREQAAEDAERAARNAKSETESKAFRDKLWGDSDKSGKPNSQQELSDNLSTFTDDSIRDGLSDPFNPAGHLLPGVPGQEYASELSGGIERVGGVRGAVLNPALDEIEAIRQQTREYLSPQNGGTLPRFDSYSPASVDGSPRLLPRSYAPRSVGPTPAMTPQRPLVPALPPPPTAQQFYEAQQKREIDRRGQETRQLLDSFKSSFSGPALPGASSASRDLADILKAFNQSTAPQPSAPANRSAPETSTESWPSYFRPSGTAPSQDVKRPSLIELMRSFEQDKNQ